MKLSDFYPQMEGATPVTAPTIPAAPQIPDSQTQVSPYLRTTLPLTLQYSPDTLKQYNRPGMSSFRIAPLPPSGNPSVNSASASVTTTSIQEFVNVAAAGPNTAVQFNISGALGGVPQFTFDTVSSTLSVIGSFFVSNPIGLASGGTGANLSATGGAHQVLRQSSVGAAITVSQLSYSDISGTLVSVPIWNTVSKNSGYTMIAGDMVEANTSGGGFTVIFPSAAANKNLMVGVKKVSSDTNNITVSSADLIDGQATQVWSSQYTCLTALSDGTTWLIV